MPQRLLIPIKDVATIEGKHILERAQHITKRYGYSTGLPSLDDYLRGGGLLPGLLYVVGARPGVGKTYFLLNLAETLSSEGIPVAFFSLELSKERLLERLAYKRSGLDFFYHWQTKTPMSEEQIAKLTEAIRELQQLPFYVRDTVRLRPQDIRETLEKEAALGVKVFMVDYLHIMKSDQNLWSREREIGTTIEAIRDHAKSLGMACVLACQLNREVEDTKPYIPSLKNFRDSGAIEQVAYIVTALYRKDYYTLSGMLTEEDEGVAFRPDGSPILDHTMNVLFLKNQDGVTGTATVRFEANTGRIVECE